jgi:hypothetical protein
MTSATLPAGMVAEASAACVAALDARERELRAQWQAGKDDTRKRLNQVLEKVITLRQRAVCLGILADAVVMCERAGTVEQMTLDATDFRLIAPWYGWSTRAHLPPLAARVRADAEAEGLSVPPRPDAPSRVIPEVAD